MAVAVLGHDLAMGKSRNGPNIACRLRISSPQMSPDKLDKLISKDRDIDLEVSPELFAELEKKLRKRR